MQVCVRGSKRFRIAGRRAASRVVFDGVLRTGDAVYVLGSADARCAVPLCGHLLIGMYACLRACACACVRVVHACYACVCVLRMRVPVCACVCV